MVAGCCNRIRINLHWWFLKQCREQVSLAYFIVTRVFCYVGFGFIVPLDVVAGVLNYLRSVRLCLDIPDDVVSTVF